MASADLSPLQQRILRALAGVEPQWTLTGGGALTGFHLHHRTTRDLDLFLHGRATLEDYATRVADRLRADGLRVSSVQSGTSMHRPLVATEGNTTILDLVADPVPVIESPERRSWGTHVIQVDTAHEILVNKLCALVQHSELRDLFDVWKLVEAGADLGRAVVDAPRKDGGFSPLTLAWLLKELALERAALAEGWPEERTRALAAFREALIARLRDLARPDPR